MCIIISKNKNCDRLPTIGELTNCFEYNRDGAGFMYVSNYRVIIEKGFMKLDDFLKRFNELCEKYNNFKNKSLVIHCRIGTSSGNTPENTHPYAVTTKENKLHKLYDETDLGVVHNGIISAYTPKDRSASVNDTQKFIMEYLAPIYKHFKTFYKMDKFREGIRAITNSKFVFLDKFDRTYYVGDFIDENGVKFSNSTYKTYTNYFSNYNFKWKSTTKNDDYYYDDDYYYEEKEDVQQEADDNDQEIIYEYYNAQKGLIYLQHDWSFYCDDCGSYEEVTGSDYDFVYDLNTGELYFINDLAGLTKYNDFATVYDKNGNEVF